MPRNPSKETPRRNRRRPIIRRDRRAERPYSHTVEPLQEGVKHDQLAEQQTHAEDRQEALLDEALEETFPSSDPISPKHIT